MYIKCAIYNSQCLIMLHFWKLLSINAIYKAFRETKLKDDNEKHYDY